MSCSAFIRRSIPVLSLVLVASAFGIVAPASASSVAGSKSSTASLSRENKSHPFALLVSAEPLGRGALVAWKPPSVAPATYEVTATPSSPIASCRVQSAEVKATASLAAIGKLCPDLPYTISIRSTWADGYTSISPLTKEVVPSTVTAPYQFAIDLAQGGDHSISAAWLQPLYDGGSPITGYVLSAQAPNHSTVSLALAPSAREAKLRGLENGVEYKIELRAINRVGTTLASAKSTPLAHPKPAAPRSFIVLPNGHGDLNATWTPGTSQFLPKAQAYRIRVTTPDRKVLSTTIVPSSKKSLTIPAATLAGHERVHVEISALTASSDSAPILSSLVSPSIVLKSTSVILDPSDVQKIVVATSSVLIFSLPVSDNLSKVVPGDVVANSTYSSTYGLFVDKVTSVSKMNNVLLLHYDSGTFLDLFSQLAMSATLPMSAPGAIGPASGVGVSPLASANWSYSKSWGSAISGSIDLNASINVTASVGPSGASINATASLSGQASISASFSWKADFDIGTLTGPTVPIGLGPIDLWLTPSVGVQAHLEASGSIAFTAGISARGTLSYSTGSNVLGLDAHFSSQKGDFSGGAQLSAGLTVTASLNIDKFITLRLMLTDTLEADLQTTSPYVQLWARAHFNAGIDVGIKLWFYKKTWSYTTPPFGHFDALLFQLTSPPSPPTGGSPTGSSPGSPGSGSWSPVSWSPGSTGAISTYTPPSTCIGWGGATPTCHIAWVPDGLHQYFAAQAGAFSSAAASFANGSAIALYCQITNGDRMGQGAYASNHWYYATGNGVGGWIPDFYTDTPINGNTWAPGIPACSATSGVPAGIPSSGAPTVPSGYVPIGVGAPAGSGTAPINYTPSPHPTFQIKWTGGQGLNRRSCPHYWAQCNLSYGPAENASVQLWCQVLDGDLAGFDSYASHHWYYATYQGLGTWIPDYYTNTPINGDTPLPGVAFCSSEDGGPAEGAGSGASAPQDIGISATGHQWPVTTVTSSVGLWNRVCPHVSSGCQNSFGPGANASLVLYCQINDGDNVLGTSTWYFATYNNNSRWTWATAAYLSSTPAMSLCTSESGTPPEFQAPSPPGNLAVTPIFNGLTVSWTPGPPNTAGNPTSHYVATAQPGGATCSSDNGLSCTIVNLSPTTVYSVTAVDQNYVAYSSASAAVTGQPLGVPSAPLATHLTAGLASIQVSWTAPSSNGGTPILKYVATAQPGGGTCTTSGALTCSIPGLLSDGSLYSISVAASNAQGGGPPSIAVQGSAWQRPSAPSGLSVVAGVHAVVASWLSDIPSDGSTVSSYTAIATPGNFSCSAIAPATTCKINGLSADGTQYTIRVVATNQVGASQQSPGVTGYSLMVPHAPSIVNVTPGVGQVTVSWSPASDGSAWDPKVGSPASDPTGGSAITGYIAIAEPGGETCTSVTALSSACAIKGLVFGTNYTITVVTVNAVGDSPKSSSVVATPWTPPSAPTNVVVSSGNATLAVSWTPTPDEQNGGTPVTSYVATAQPGGATCTSSGTGHSCSLVGLNPATQYIIWVQAVNAAGQSDSSLPGYGNTFAIPGEPDNFNVVAGNRVLKLSWTAPGDTGGTPTTGYNVVVTDGVKNYSCASSQTGADETSCTVTGLVNGGNYAVTIQAINIVGKSIVYIDQQSASPQPTAPAPPTLSLSRVNTSTSASSAVLSVGTPTDDGGAPISSVTVVVTDVQTGDIVNAVNASVGSNGVTTITAPSLVLGRAYALTAYVANTIGSSLPSPT
ncbi:MAG: fibronectin type III domain-containing protein, partial [Actinomycetota bacterium]